MDSSRRCSALLPILLLCLAIHVFAANAIAQITPKDEERPQGPSETKDATLPEESGEARDAAVPEGRDESKDEDPLDENREATKPSSQNQQVPASRASDEPKQPLNFTHFLMGIALGFVIGLMRLVRNFYRFLGLGVCTHWSSWFFLVYVSAFSGLSYYVLIPLLPGLVAQLEPFKGLQDAGLLGIFVSPIAGNICTILGRAFSPPDAGTTAKPKDLQAFKTVNFFNRLILDSVKLRMDDEVERMAEQYNWDLIKDATQRLVNIEFAAEDLSEEEAESIRKQILAYQPNPDKNKDFHCKCRALGVLLRVTSFRRLQSVMTRVAHEQA